jgi:hypothetical protein
VPGPGRPKFGTTTDRTNSAWCIHPARAPSQEQLEPAPRALIEYYDRTCLARFLLIARPSPERPRAKSVIRARTRCCAGLHSGLAAQSKMRAWWDASPRPSIDQCHTRSDLSLHVVYLLHYTVPHVLNTYSRAKADNKWAPNHVLLWKGYPGGLWLKKWHLHPLSPWKGKQIKQWYARTIFSPLPIINLPSYSCFLQYGYTLFPHNYIIKMIGMIE